MILISTQKVAGMFVMPSRDNSILLHKST